MSIVPKSSVRDHLKVVMVGAALDAHGGVAAVERLIARNCPEDVQLRHVASMSDGSVLAKARTFAGALSLARRTGRREPPDVFYLHVAVKGSVVRKALLAELALPRATPYVLHAHGGDFNDWFARQPTMIRRLATRLFTRARLVVALSNSWAAFYESAFSLPAGRVRVLPNPVGGPRAIPDRTGRDRFRFLFLGSMDERKGAFRTVRAFSALPHALRGRARLTLAGNGRVAELRDEVARLGLDGTIEVMDWMDERERDRALADSDAYVLPSLNEGLPMGLLEAMSWGLPVITSPVGGIPEVVVDGENGLLVDPSDESALAVAMRRLLDNPALCAELSQAARSTSTRFDIASYWRRLEPILRSATERANA